MRHLGLFEGIGGFALAARWMGWETVAWVEFDSRCQKVLSNHFTEAKGYGDIREFTGELFRGSVDIITGGFPCQTFSLAGKGAVDLSLWKEMLRVIREVQPKFIVAENVYGILARKEGVALRTVYDDLENAGYTTMAPIIIPACSVDAPHQRDRVWIVAYSNSLGGIQYIKESETLQNEKWNVEIQERGRKTESNGFGGGTQTSNWQEWEVEPLLCGEDDALPDRMDRIKEIGNAVDPMVVFEIFKAIEKLILSNETDN